MKAGTEIIGGKLTVSSGLGQGTEVSLIVFDMY
jgi:signal transduction histidine kinase